jgi:hypothetical protein
VLVMMEVFCLQFPSLLDAGNESAFKGKPMLEYMVFDVSEWTLGKQNKLIPLCSTIQLPLLLNHDTILARILCVLLIHSVKLTIRTSIFLITIVVSFFCSFINLKIYLGGAYGLADSMELNCVFIWIAPSVYLGLYGFDDNFYMIPRIV